jgi:hypothetical protein
MFAFHETTRKRICRMAFFALCVAPTCVTAYWMAGHFWPGRLGRTARSISDALDVHVKLADWRESRPNTVRSSGLTLSDASTGNSLVEVRSLELRSGGGRRFAANEIVVDAGTLASLFGKLNAWLAKLPPEIHEFRCERLLIQRSNSLNVGDVADRTFMIALEGVQGRVERDRAGRVQAHFAAHIAGAEAGSGGIVRLTLAPSQQQGSVAATVTFDASQCMAPAWALGEFLPGFGRVGANARFSGGVQWMLDQPEVRGAASGQLSTVDLEQILPAGSPHKLAGTARIDLSELYWRGGQIERLAGSIIAERAGMSRSLLDAMVTTFDCGQGSDGDPMEGDASMIALDLLAVRFELHEAGLTIWGHCPAEANMQEGCMAVSGLQPLLIAPRYYNWALGKLVQVIAGPSSAWLPASREAIDMGSRLPLPLR